MTTGATEAETPEPAKTQDQIDAEMEVSTRCELTVALRGLNFRERRWMRAVMECEGRAYKAAGVAKIGKATVHRLLRQERVQRAIKAVQAVLLLDLEVSMYRIQQEHHSIAFARLKDCYHPDGHPLVGQLKKPHEWDDATAAAIAGYEFDKNGDPMVKMHDKGRSLEALTRLRNLGPPARLELTGKDGQALGSVIPVIEIARYSDAPAPAPTPESDAEPDPA